MGQQEQGGSRSHQQLSHRWQLHQCRGALERQACAHSMTQSKRRDQHQEGGGLHHCDNGIVSIILGAMLWGAKGCDLGSRIEKLQLCKLRAFPRDQPVWRPCSQDCFQVSQSSDPDEWSLKIASLVDRSVKDIFTSGYPTANNLTNMLRILVRAGLLLLAIGGRMWWIRCRCPAKLRSSCSHHGR